MKKIFLLTIFIVTLLSGENIFFKKGWNLKGSSYEIDIKNSKSKCFEGFWKYRNSWEYLEIGKSGSIEKDSGFWVKAKEDCNFSAIYSNTQKNSFIQIQEGWNLIGVSEEEWFSNINTNLISNAFIYSTDKNMWSNFLINSNNSFLLEKDRGIWIKSAKNLKLNYLNLKNAKNIFKGKLVINGKIWDSASVTLNGIKAEGKSDINGNFIIKNLNSKDKCLNLTATKLGYEPFKTKVERNLQSGVKLCENTPTVNNSFAEVSYIPTSTTTVTPSPTIIEPKNVLESIFISPTTLSLKIGETSNLKVIGEYTDNSQKDETNNTTFKVSNENILSINNSGVISAKSAGDTQITATIGNLTNAISVKVTKSLESISVSITPTNLTLLKGESANLKVIGNYSDNSKEDLTSSATFTSSNEANVSIDSSGSINALNVGSSTIEVKLQNFSQTLNLNVIAKDTTIQGSDIMGSYSDLIAPNATVEKFDEKRFCVLKGAIKEIDGMPLSNVEVSIKEHPEYGSVKSDINGEFAIAIEGGGVVTLRYIKDGFTIVDRQIEAPWSDIAIADDITMLKKDSKVTPIKLDGTKQVHSSTPYSDDRGVRATTLVFNGVTKATVTKEDGTIEELNNISVRATEFITPESMPADLPPQSAYTYCTDLTIDEAPDSANVEFDKPIVMYVNNFLGFDVGEIVPVGFYDRQNGVWKANNNGVVVKLLDNDGDGIVDSLDSDGDGVANDLNSDGNTSDEVEGLEDSTTYKAGVSYWRVEISHFTPWDCNWPYGPPADAEAPDMGNVSSDNGLNSEKARDSGSGNGLGNGSGRDKNNCQIKTNSYIEPTDRSFHEDIPIAGTDLTLHYSSKRVDGYKYQISVPIKSVPNSVESIIVTMKIAGREYKKTFSPEPNQILEFIWDGRDFRNYIVNGKVKAKITVNYTYKVVYYKSLKEWKNAFGRVGSEATGIRGRSTMSFSKTFVKELVNTSRDDIANGWSLSNHNKWLSSWRYENGRGEIKMSHSTNIVKVIAGNGSGSYCGDGDMAIDACLYSPRDVEVDNIGNIYIADFSNYRVRKIDRDGIITTVFKKNKLLLKEPVIRGIEIDKFGNIYIADSGNDKIFKIDINDTISSIVDGYGAFCGDGGNAKEACICLPFDIAFDNIGNLYIADGQNQRIRKIDTNGIITTIAGGGDNYYTSSSSDATQVRLYYPNDVIVDKFGNIYFSEFGRRIINKIDTSGVISIVIGDKFGFCGDGGKAIDACLGTTINGKFTLDSIGNMYIVDEVNNVIRKINTNGIISTIVGNKNGICIDEGSANEVCLNRPKGAAIDNENNLYIADTENNRILKVSNVIDSNKTTITNSNLLYEFNSNFKHSKTIDLATKKELNQFVYDEEGRLIASIDNFNNQITINRDENGKVTSIVSPYGHITTMNVDENNNLTSVNYEDNSSYGFEYSDGSLMTAMTKPNGENFYHSFDDVGRLVSTSDPEGGVWSFDKSVDGSTNTIYIYSPEGEEKQYITIQNLDGSFENSTILASGEKTSTITSSNDSNITSLACEVSSVSKFTYDEELKESYVSKVTTTLPSGLTKIVEMNKSYEGKDLNFTSITKNYILNSKMTSVVQDINNSKFITTSPESRVVTNYYDSETLLPTKEEIAELLPTEYSYDSKGRISTIKVGDRNSSYSYNDRGNVKSFVDSKGLSTSYEYDLLDRVVKITKPSGDEIHFSYDAMGAMTMLKVPTTAEHNFTYNSLGKNTSYTTPLSKVTTYKYDKDRRLKEVLLDSNGSIVYNYTNGKLATILTPDWQIDYTYACLSNIASITKGSEKLEYSYDGELTIATIQSGVLNKTINFSYNNDFDISSITYAGATNSFSYDLDGLLTSSSGFSINRNALNGLAESVGDGTFKVDRVFNGYSEIDSEAFSINSAPFYSYEILARDEVGRVTSKRETLDGNITEWSYSYDDLGRLVEVTKSGVVVESYEYDSNGNRISTTSIERDINATASYTLADTVETFGNVAYVFDNDGYLKLKNSIDGNVTYTYSRTGELLKVEDDNKTIEYTHDPLGRRVSKSIDSVVVEKYLWLDRTTLLAVYDSNDNLLQRFNYSDDRMPNSMESNGVTYYLAYNQVGSLRVVSDSSGNIVKEVSYDSFGNIISDSNSNFKVPFGFAGGLYDSDTNLTRFGYRDYDPNIGKWTARDPILFEGGDYNLYGYVLNDSINLVDPSGLCWEMLQPTEMGSEEALFKDKDGKLKVHNFDTDENRDFFQKQKVGAHTEVPNKARDEQLTELDLKKQIPATRPKSGKVGAVIDVIEKFLSPFL